MDKLGGTELYYNDSIEKYLYKKDWKIKENSNMTYSLQGMNFHISSLVTSQYWLERIYTPQIREAHEKGYYHIHDLGILGVYCVGWDLQDLLNEGFTGVRGKITSRPAKHFRSALGQIVNFLYTLQGEAAGAQAFSNFDTLLAPFIRYDNLDYKQVKQALQEFAFNMNVPTRVGFQTVFSNISLDLQPPSYLKDSPVIIGGQMMDETYGDFQAEMDIFNQAFAEVMTEGDGVSRVFTFPIPTYNITENFDWDNPVYEKIWEMTAKYGIPYFSNFIGSDMNPEDARSMCPLHPDTKVIVRSEKGLSIRTIKDIFYSKSKGYEVLHNGKWIKASMVSLVSEGCVEISINNGTNVIMDVRHEQPIKRKKGDPIEVIPAGEITPGMWVPFNSAPLSDNTDNYYAGYAVGAYLGDGSLDGGGIIYSLNTDKKMTAKDTLESFFANIGFSTSTFTCNHLLSLRIGCANYAAEHWIRQYVEGDQSSNKRLKPRAYKMGKSFLQGILDGWYATDGGNRGRIYTTSPYLVEDFQFVCGLLGYAYKIGAIDNRENRLSEKPVYTLKFHTRLSYKDCFFYEDGYHWFKVQEVLPNRHKENVYCFVVESDEKVFQLANGLVTHNCRLRLDNRELRKRGGGLFGSNPLTGSIGVVTINMARLGIESYTEQEFFDKLKSLIELASDSLEIKRQVLEKLTDAGLYPYSKFYLRASKEQFGQYWHNHFSTVGLIGMNEACHYLLNCNIAEPKGQQFAIKVLEFMRKMLADCQEKTGNLYNLEATPAEGCSYSLWRKDDEKFDLDVPFYTNSTQLPVDFTDDLWEALQHQEPLQSMYTGGTVFHVFLGEAMPDMQTVKKLLKKMCQFKIPYYSFTPSFSICPEHGYLKGEQTRCPHCNSETEVYSRVVGYLRPVSQYNLGKQKEFQARKKFDSAGV
jgi:anaerobic ribonucleoside-triphosphate reductase